MEAAVNAWISDNNHDFLNVTNSTHEFLEVVIHGKPIQLIVPDAFYAQSAKNNSEEVFMAVREDDESDTEFDSSLYLLNEKLERVKVGPNCLNTVLDCIATSFRTYRKRPKISLNEEIDKRAVKNGYLFKLSKEAKAICEETRAKGSLDYLSYSGKPKSAEEILFWCDVSADPDSYTVILEIELIGIIDYFHLAEALGFCFENPLKINLLFEKKLWQRDDISSDNLSSEARVKASCQGDGFEFQGCEAQSVKIRSLYGPEVLVPELVKLFFRNGEGNDVTMLTWEDFGNQFVQLLIFVGMRLSMLPRWCLICKRQLPFCPSRLCTCNSPTWNGLRHFGCSSCVSGRTSNAECINVSSQLSAALVHSTKSNIEWENGTLKEGFLIAAIFEVSFKSGSCVDSTSMMVSVEHEDTALRYLIVLKDPYRYNNIHIVDGHSLSGKIDLHSHYKHVREEYKRMEFGRCMIYKQHRKDIFDKRIVKTNPGDCAETFSASVSTSLGAFALELESASNFKTTSSMKTIMKEYHNLSKVLEHGQTNSTGLVGVRLKLPDENNICRWHVSLSQDLFRDHPLYKDLLEYARQKNLGQACILLELTFPPDYPFAPPFVRIVRPRFKRCTGHITVGGSICMELLTRSGWSPACSVESLLVQVQNAIIEGGGRLDKTALLSDDEYNEREAHEAFDRVALDHRWA